MSQQTLTIAKASKVYKDQDLPDVVILIHGEPTNPPTGANWEANYSRFYRSEGQRLADALVRSLPGGTLDQLLMRLLDHKASLFRVPLPTKVHEAVKREEQEKAVRESMAKTLGGAR